LSFNNLKVVIYEQVYWLIENQLHYVKDVNLHEDTSGILNPVAASHLSILRNIAINVARQNCCESIKGAAIFFASNIKNYCKSLELNSPALPQAGEGTNDYTA
jgi:hypothetical protein